MTKPNAVPHLLHLLDSIPHTAIAVSGGVDSMTLAVLAHREKKRPVEIFHAVSPAVPEEASERVRSYAKREGWPISILDAGEFADSRYRSNPVNRCFYCKSNLYDAIAARTQAQIVSGTNLDDMRDFRPGLEAARARSVRHPYVEAAVGKNTVRDIARWLDLSDIAELPASPCLSSRIETGIAVEPALLGMVSSVERLINNQLSPRTVRCRIRSTSVVVEMDDVTLRRIEDSSFEALRDEIVSTIRRHGCGKDVRFKPYSMGSAFLRHLPHKQKVRW